MGGDIDETKHFFVENFIIEFLFLSSLLFLTQLVYSNLVPLSCVNIIRLCIPTSVVH